MVRLPRSLILALVCGFLFRAAGAASADLVLSGTHLFGGQSLMTVDPLTGAETLVGTVQLQGGGTVTIAGGALAYDALTDRLYANGYDASSTSVLCRIDPSTAVATLIGPSGALHNLSLGGLAFDPVSRVLYGTGTETGASVQGTFLYAVDTLTGAATPIGHTGAPGTYLHSLGCDPVTGVLYGQGYRSFNSRSSLFTVDKGTGAATFVGEHGVEIGRSLMYSDLAFHPQTNVLYVTGSTSASRSGLYTVDKATGAASLVGEFAVGTGAADGGLAFVGTGTPSGAPAAPADLRLHQNRPNPFNPRTTLRFELAEAGPVRLAVHDAAGRLVRVLLAGDRPAGAHEVAWDGRDAAGRAVGSGTYLALLRTGTSAAAIRMTLVR